MAAGKGIVMKDGKPAAPVVQKKYQIVFVTAELGPYSKTGGLGEAMDGLSIALAGLGHRVMVVTPRYDQYEEAWDTSFWSSVKMGGKEESVHSSTPTSRRSTRFSLITLASWLVSGA